MWHKKLGNASLRFISKLKKNNLVSLSKNFVSTSSPLELLHIDLFGSTKTTSLGGKHYGPLPIRISLLRSSLYYANVIKMKNFSILVLLKVIMGEFEDENFQQFYEEHEIDHNFSCPRTPLQNGVVERKNISLKEMSRTMLNGFNFPKYLWAEAVNTTCYLQNRIYIRPILKKTSYDLWNGRQANISYFYPFICDCFILNNKDNLGKFDPKSNKGIFIGYPTTSKAYKVYNSRTLKDEESINVKFNNSKPDKELLELIEPFVELNTKEFQITSKESILDEEPKTDKVETFLRTNRVRTWSTFKDEAQMALLSKVEPKNVEEALLDNGWILVMQEELDQL
ncbi:hypothetical protein CR513_12906, partial [Mucuna pruriens]